MSSTVDQLRRELAEMRTAMARQQERIDQLEASVPAAPESPKRSRRQLLKLAGATLAGAAAGAAGIAGKATPAFAASGDNMILGHSQNTLDGNVADLATQVDYTGAANVGAAFVAQAGTSFNAGAAAFPCALAGWSELAAMPNGVYGYTNVAGGNALTAFNGNNTTGGPGVFSQSRRGYAGHFALLATGKSHLYLQPTGAAGAPAPAGHVNGELYVDSNGVLYYFSNGAFNPLAGGQGGLTTMLAAPIRLLETRPPFEDPSPGQTKPHRPLNSGETFDLPIAGQVIGGLSVPVGAKAVIGNVTVTNSPTGGFLKLFPHGAPLPATSSINYGAGAAVANGVIVGLSPSGHLDIYVNGQTDVIFDAAGYVL